MGYLTRGAPDAPFPVKPKHLRIGEIGWEINYFTTKK